MYLNEQLPIQVFKLTQYLLLEVLVSILNL